MRCVVAHLLLTVVDCRRLNDNRQISARTDRNRMADKLFAEKFCVFFFQSETIIFFLSVPFFQFYDKVNTLRFFDTLNTEQCLHVDDTDTS